MTMTLLWKTLISFLLLAPGVKAEGEGSPPLPPGPPSELGDDEITKASNSIVDIVLGSPDHTILGDLVVAAGLPEVLSATTGTLFAPTDAAFEALGTETLTRLLDPVWVHHLQDVLFYHVIMDEVVRSGDLTLGLEPSMANGETTSITSLEPAMINQATIGPADLEADNGVVHVIDSVLLPESATVSIADAVAATPETFSTLGALLEAANLTQTLGSSEGPFTVFAPTDQAFAALDNETITFLATPEGLDTLTDILLYHVYPGILLSEGGDAGLAYRRSEIITMVDGYNATLGVVQETSTTQDVAGDGTSSATGAIVNTYTINDATILEGDFLFRNGVLHVIDTVLVPEIVA